MKPMLGSEFLQFISGVKRLIGFNSFLKEESKEKEDFDWLFLENAVPVPKPVIQPAPVIS